MFLEEAGLTFDTSYCKLHHRVNVHELHKLSGSPVIAVPVHCMMCTAKFHQCKDNVLSDYSAWPSLQLCILWWP